MTLNDPRLRQYSIKKIAIRRRWRGSGGNYLRQMRRYMFLPVFVCLSVCLSVSKITQKRLHRFGLYVECRSDVGTWTNWLTFEPDPGHSPDAGTGLLSPISYRLWNFAACLGCKRAALLRGIYYAEFYVGKIPRIRIGGAPLERAVVLKWFYSLSCRRPLSEANALYRVPF